MLPIFRLTFLESSCNFRQFGSKNDGYFFRLDGSLGPTCLSSLYRFPGQHSLAFHRPHVLATSSMAGRNNGANCFARVERKLVLTGARAMIHREDLRDERVRVRAGKGFRAHSMRNRQIPEISSSISPTLKFTAYFHLETIGTFLM